MTTRLLESIQMGVLRGRALAEFVRYFIASGGALAVDVGLYRVTMHLGLAYWLAALIGFSAGAVFAYLASIFWVFDQRSVRHASTEFGLFVIVGICGALLTEALLWLAISRFGWSALWSKFAAAAIVFFFNFSIRKAILFTERVHSSPQVVERAQFE